MITMGKSIVAQVVVLDLRRMHVPQGKFYQNGIWHHLDNARLCIDYQLESFKFTVIFFQSWLHVAKIKGSLMSIE